MQVALAQHRGDAHAHHAAHPQEQLQHLDAGHRIERREGWGEDSAMAATTPIATPAPIRRKRVVAMMTARKTRNCSG